MGIYTGPLRAAGLAKESVLGTLISTPTIYIPVHPSDTFYPTITPLESKGIFARADLINKVVLGPGEVKGMKAKWEAEPENIGEQLMAAFGTDTMAEVATFVVTSGSNAKINFKEDAGAELTATLTAATYAMGTSSAQAGTLCAQVKTALQAAAGAVKTYTVTYSYSTKKMTITASSGTVQFLWSTGTNAAISARTLLGFTAADTSAALAVTSNSTTQQFAMTHTFTRAAVSQLPTYSWWFDKGNIFPLFAGGMMNKLEIGAKAKEFVMIDTDWTGLSYDTSGTSKSPTYSTLRPFGFNQVNFTIDGAQSLYYDDFKVTVENNVKADHVLGSSIYPGVIYAEGMRVTIGANFFFNDAVQYNKFLAGSFASMLVTIASSDIIVGTTPYSLVISAPLNFYSAAPIPNPSGVLKVAFATVLQYDPSTSKTVSMALTNTVGSSY